jgi:hypothetical protein
MTSRNLRILFVAAALAGTSLVQTAHATPGSGFAPSPVVIGHYGPLDVKTESDKVGHWGMNLKTKDDPTSTPIASWSVRARSADGTITRRPFS